MVPCSQTFQEAIVSNLATVLQQTALEPAWAHRLHTELHAKIRVGKHFETARIGPEEREAFLAAAERWGPERVLVSEVEGELPWDDRVDELIRAGVIRPRLVGVFDEAEEDQRRRFRSIGIKLSYGNGISVCREGRQHRLETVSKGHQARRISRLRHQRERGAELLLLSYEVRGLTLARFLAEASLEACAVSRLEFRASRSPDKHGDSALRVIREIKGIAKSLPNNKHRRKVILRSLDLQKGVHVSCENFAGPYKDARLGGLQDDRLPVPSRRRIRTDDQAARLKDAVIRKPEAFGFEIAGPLKVDFVVLAELKAGRINPTEIEVDGRRRGVWSGCLITNHIKRLVVGGRSVFITRAGRMRLDPVAATIVLAEQTGVQLRCVHVDVHTWANVFEDRSSKRGARRMRQLTRLLRRMTPTE